MRFFFYSRAKRKSCAPVSLFYYWICRIFFSFLLLLLLLRLSNSVHCLLFALLLYFINFVVIWRCWCHGMLSDIQCCRLGVPLNTSVGRCAWWLHIDSVLLFLRTFQKLNNFFFIYSLGACANRGLCKARHVRFFSSHQDMSIHYNPVLLKQYIDLCLAICIECSMYAVFTLKSYSSLCRLFYWHSSISIPTSCPKCF